MKVGGYPKQDGGVQTADVKCSTQSNALKGALEAEAFL